MIGEIEGLICYLCSLGASYASAKTLEREGRISSSSFFRQLADKYSHVFSLFHPLPLDESSFKEMRKWDLSKISSCYLCVWCNSKELIDRVSPRFPTPVVENSSADLLPPIKRYWAESHLQSTLWLNPGARLEHLTNLRPWIAAYYKLLAFLPSE